MGEVWIELAAVGKALLLGILLRLCYDGIRIFRAVLPHNRLVAAAEDFIYWVLTALFLFLLLYETSEGMLRGVIILCVFLGMLICAAIDKKIELFCRRVLKLFEKRFIMPLLRLKGERHRNGQHKKRSEADTKKFQKRKKGQ